MMPDTECTVNVARHARRIDRANQLGWLAEDQPKASRTATCRTTGWMARVIRRLHPSRRPQVETSV